MTFSTVYKSPVGDIVIKADEIGITELILIGKCKTDYKCDSLPVLSDAVKWLDIYFSGDVPDFSLPLHFIGSDFQKEVFDILCTIPYGKTMSYKEIAKIIADKRNIKYMSSQAVGGAVGKNRFPIIVPCHRVIGSNGSLVGYSGGMDIKIALLKLEKAECIMRNNKLLTHHSK